MLGEEVTFAKGTAERAHMRVYRGWQEELVHVARERAISRVGPDCLPGLQYVQNGTGMNVKSNLSQKHTELLTILMVLGSHS